MITMTMRIEILVGNTNNLESQREISYDEAYTFAKSHNMNYFEMNVVTGENVFESKQRETTTRVKKA